MNKKNSGFYMRTSRSDKANISRLANQLRVTEADAVRLAVAHLLQSGEVPNIHLYMRRPIVPRRKVTG